MARYLKEHTGVRRTSTYEYGTLITDVCLDSGNRALVCFSDYSEYVDVADLEYLPHNVIERY